jgi:putative hemolysin
MEENNSIQLDIERILQQRVPTIAKKIPRFALNYLIRTVHQKEINDILTRYHDKEGVEFMIELLDYFKLTLKIVGEENIPTSGRYTFVSNHPLGGLDGICLSAVIGEKFQGKIKYPVNDLLLNLPNLKSIFIPINKHGAQGRKNARIMDEAYLSDNQIITFPAGMCSRKENGVLNDSEWKKSFIQKSIEYQRDIVPIYFGGENSSFFYRLARFRKKLGFKVNYEMIYLPDEIFTNKTRTFTIYFGKPISWETFNKDKSASQWAAWVKEIAYNLVKI